MIRIRSVALGLVMLAGSAAVAGAQSTTATPPAGHGQHRGWGKGAERGQMSERMHQRLFQGIDLTADQKARIKQIHDRYAEQGKSLRESARPDMQAARDARRGGDTTAARAAFARTADERQKMRALHEQALGEIRGVLTPAQQKTFDANVAAMKTERDARMKHRGPRGQRQG